MINNPSAAPSAQTTRVARAIWAAMQTQSANNAKNFITKLTKEETAAALESGTDIAEFAVGVGRGGRVKIACYVFKNTHSLSLPPPQGMDVALFKEAYEDQKFDFLLSHAAYCRDVLKLKKGQTAVISNGRVSHGRAMPDKYSLKKKKTIHLPINASAAHKTVVYSAIHLFIHLFLFFPDNWPAGAGRGFQPGRLPATGEHHLQNFRRSNQKQNQHDGDRGGQVGLDAVGSLEKRFQWLSMRKKTTTKPTKKMNGFVSGPAT